MPSNISFMLTTRQVRNKTKTVTRRLGWKKLKPGQILNACEKCQGIKAGERIVVICQIRVVSTRWEPLSAITQEDVALEGFPEMSPVDFIRFFADANKCSADELVNRIEFEYLGAPGDNS